MKKPYKPLTKSRKNNSGKKSQAKREAEAESFAMRNPKKTVMKTKRKGRERLAQGIPYKEKPLQSMTVRQLPESDLIRKGMTLRQLIRATPRFFLVGAVDVEAVQIDDHLWILPVQQAARPKVARHSPVRVCNG